MKKIIGFFISLVLVLNLSACGNTQSQTGDPSVPTSESMTTDTISREANDDNSLTPESKMSTDETDEGSKSPEAYISMPGTTDPDNMTQEEDNSGAVIDREVLGNTQSKTEEASIPKSESINQNTTSSEANDKNSQGKENKISTAETNENNKTLVVYFSMPETTDPDNMTQEEDNSVVVIDGEVLGNTQYVASVIQENTGADIFRIEPATPYPIDHDTLVDLAANEQDQNARPKLKANVENLDQYDTIFIGYPNWWGDMPMILYTFFDSNDFSGKTIIPFNTHDGSGFSSTISTIAELEPNATVNEEGYTVSRNNAEEAEPNIVNWLKDLGYAK